MEGQVVRRRIRTISGHLSAGILTEDATAPNTHLIPLNCSSNFSSTLKRLDNRLLFARQASDSQGQFMRQATSTMEQENLQDARPGACSAKCRNEAKPTAAAPPSFSRPGSTGPLFARPVQKEQSCSDIGTTESLKHDKSMLPASERSSSATPQEKQVTCTRQMVASKTMVCGWSPRINVIESNSRCVITVELPGVEINDIRVEMDDKNIIVRGNRSMKWWKTTGGLNDSFTTYHRREISQGPYQVVWPLPPGREYFRSQFLNLEAAEFGDVDIITALIQIQPFGHRRILYTPLP
ncbi:hypothetical protein RDABS01_020950 [Bienertia sinuspersici]